MARQLRVGGLHAPTKAYCWSAAERASARNPGFRASLILFMPHLGTSLADYTQPGLIVPELKSGGTAGVIGELCSALKEQGRVKDALEVYNAVIHRELVCSTAAPPGWAMPHARIRSQARLAFAVGRTARDLDWLGEGEEPVRLVFLFVVPEHDTFTYLSVLAGMAKLSQSSGHLRSLFQAPTPEQIFDVLRQISIPQRQPARV